MPDNWYVQSGGQQLGPMPLESVQRMKAEGRLQPADLIWAEGWTQWQPAGEVAELGSAAGIGSTATAGEAVQGAVSQAVAQPAASPLSYQSPYPGGLEYRGTVNQPVMATERAIQALMRTRPWVMLWAVLLFIGAAFSVIGILAMVVVGALDRDGEAMTFAAVFGLVYLLVAVFYFFAGLYLTKYFAAIGRTNRLRRPEDLESALSQQFRFWRLTGIALATIIVAYLVIFVGAMTFGLLS